MVFNGGTASFSSLRKIMSDFSLDDVLQYGKQGVELAQAGVNIFDPASPSPPQVQNVQTVSTTNYTPFIIGGVILIAVLLLAKK